MIDPTHSGLNALDNILKIENREERVEAWQQWKNKYVRVFGKALTATLQQLNDQARPHTEDALIQTGKDCVARALANHVHVASRMDKTKDGELCKVFEFVLTILAKRD